MTSRSGFGRPGIPCTAGSDWKEEQLAFFRIKISKIRQFDVFFGQAPPNRFNNAEDIEEFLNLDLSDVLIQQKISMAGLKSRLVKTLVKDMVAVTKTHRFEESAVDDLSRSLLQLFEFDLDERAIRTRGMLDLEMSNGKTNATPDVYVEILDTSIKLLVQEDKSYDVGNDRHLKGHHPEAQLMAEALAAYQENVKLYDRLGREEFPDQQMIPGIVMLGTCPTFYLIPITKELSKCVSRGEEPAFTTEIKKYTIPNLPVNFSDAMLSKELRYEIAKCCESFRQFV